MLKLSPKPKISIHYVAGPTALWEWRSKWPYLVLAVAITSGLGLGGVLSWSALTSQAEPVPTGQVLGVETTDSWNSSSKPLDYDQTELNVVANFFNDLIEENHREPATQEVVRNEQAIKLRKFFASYNSPFAKDDGAIKAFLDSRNMHLMIAISFVESSLGKKCYYNNCSGIGGYPPRLRKYETRADWIRDFDEVLEKGYKGVPIEDFLGVYVQPGSANWLNGVKQILAELEEQGIE